jgi:hypothetical protein
MMTVSLMQVVKFSEQKKWSSLNVSNQYHSLPIQDLGCFAIIRATDSHSRGGVQALHSTPAPERRAAVGILADMLGSYQLWINRLFVAHFFSEPRFSPEKIMAGHQPGACTP